MALWDEVTHWDGHWGWCSYGSGGQMHRYMIAALWKTYYMGMSVSYTENKGYVSEERREAAERSGKTWRC